MAVYVACPSCETRLKVPDNLVGLGRVVKCPKCAKPFNLSAAGADPAPPKEGTDELELVQDEPRATPRKPVRVRRDDEDDEDRPRKKRPRDDEEDEYDDRPARRGPRKAAKKKAGGQLGLIIGLSVGGVVLLLGCCGVGAYFLYSRGSALAGLVDNPAVTDANFQRVQTDMTLPAVEAIFGPGAPANGGDLKGLLSADRPGLETQLVAVADNPAAHGITALYRWKNGPATMIVGVDGTNKVRIAGLVKAAPNSRSSSWQSSLVLGGGGGVPRPPIFPKRGR